MNIQKKINTSDNSNEMGQIFAEIKPIQELRLGQMSWLTDSESELSRTIAKEVNREIGTGSNRVRFATFNKVMREAIAMGMKLMGIRDVGMFVSWLIINTPCASSKDADDRHNDICVNLGCWNCAASLDGLTGSEKARFGNFLWRYAEAHRADIKKSMGVAHEYVSNVGHDEAMKTLDANLSGDFMIIGMNGPPYRIDIERKCGGDVGLLTESGYKKGKEQGWLEDNRSYVLHRMVGMINVPQFYFDFFREDVRKVIDSK